MTHIGIDPGKHGGFAAIVPTPTGPCVYDAMPMPMQGGEIDVALLADLVRAHQKNGQVRACVEKVGAMPKQGVVSTFTFGMGYGKVLGVFGTLGVPVDLVTPQAWKKVILAGTEKDKDAAVAWCRRVYSSANLIPPGCRVPHDGIADAICIAEYSRRTFA